MTTGKILLKPQDYPRKLVGEKIILGFGKHHGNDGCYMCMAHAREVASITRGKRNQRLKKNEKIDESSSEVEQIKSLSTGRLVFI